MPNRYANLVPSKKISEDFQNVTTGFDKVQEDVDNLQEKIEGLDTLSPADRTKLDGIEDGAQVNQNSFSKVNDLEAEYPSDELTIDGGTGIAITTVPGEKKVRVTATGSSTPGEHGSAHTEFGADPIPNATDTEGGLMSAADKAALDGIGDGIADLAGPGRTTETVKGNADAIAAHQAEKATEEELGHVRVDGTTIMIDEEGVLTVPPSGDFESLESNVNTRAINVKYPPPPLVAAVGGGVVDDYPAFQGALDLLKTLGGGQLIAPYDTYRWDTGIKIGSHHISLDFHSSTFDYYGTGSAISADLIGGTIYPVDCHFHPMTINLKTAGTALSYVVGVKWQFSHSTARGIAVSLQKSYQRGYEYLGDVNGTGPYYNVIIKCDAQGKRGIDGTVTNQYGVWFSYDPSSPSRCPNANTFIGGRMGQLDIGRRINGGGNTLVNPVSEGIIDAHYDFDNPDAALGCVNNTVTSCYIEGANPSKAIRFGVNAIGTKIDLSKVTSIGGLGNLVEDNSTSKDHVITYPGSMYRMPILNAIGLTLDVAGNVGIFVRNGSPEGVITAGPGSLCFNKAGGASTTLYVKQTGTGNTGWVGK